MNLENLENSLLRHKIKSPETYDEIINISVPLLIMNKLMQEKLTLMHHQKHELSSVEVDVLASLKLSGDESYILSPTKLYSSLLFSSGGMTKVLNKLEKKELITRISNQHDKRSKLVQLSKKGELVLSKALKEVVNLEKDFYKALSKEEQTLFKELTFKILADK